MNTGRMPHIVIIGTCFEHRPWQSLKRRQKKKNNNNFHDDDVSYKYASHRGDPRQGGSCNSYKVELIHETYLSLSHTVTDSIKGKYTQPITATHSNNQHTHTHTFLVRNGGVVLP